jgi:F-type H+-transporting ATPase subunit c
MKKSVQLAGLVVMVLLAAASPAFAQTPSSSILSGPGFGVGLASLGAALTIIGAGYGFGKIGASALESMARQPEVAGRILPAMIVIAALLEGATFFALLVCFSVLSKDLLPLMH